MSSCPEMKRLEDWARQGSQAAVPPDLEIHAATCAQCRTYLDEVLQVREQCAALPTAEVSEERLDSIRFAIMAGARRSNSPAPKARRWPTPRMLLAAAMLTLLALALRSVLVGGAAAPVPQDDAAPLAEVRFSPGAVGSQVSAGPDEVVAIEHGTAEFAVRELGEGERFRVVAGEDAVEVRGTRFRVEAEDQRLMRVDVAEGRVVVSVDGTVAAELRAGQHWSRPSDEATAPEARAASRGSDETVAQELAGSGAGSLPAAGVTETKHQKHTLAGSRPGQGARRLDSRTDADRVSPRPAVSMGRHDVAFQRAWKLLQAGKAKQAAAAFDALAREQDLDAPRRADVLYWSAKAHQQSGDSSGAQARADELLEQEPDAWHAPHAALLMGESLVEQGKPAEARRWLRRAAATGSPAVQRRAHQLLEKTEQ